MLISASSLTSSAPAPCSRPLEMTSILPALPSSERCLSIIDWCSRATFWASAHAMRVSFASAVASIKAFWMAATRRFLSMVRAWPPAQLAGDLGGDAAITCAAAIRSIRLALPLGLWLCAPALAPGLGLRPPSSGPSIFFGGCITSSSWSRKAAALAS